MTPPRKSATTDANVLFDSVEVIEVNTIKGHPKNPRVGDIDVIAESLQRYKQYRPILVNKRNKQIVAGHHTWLAARKLGWKTISAAFIDVDEDTHQRIMLMDNKSAEMGTYDEAMLAEILKSLDDPLEGTGFRQEELDALLDAAEAGAVSATSSILDGIEEEAEEQRREEESRSFDGSDFGDEPDYRDDPTLPPPSVTKGGHGDQDPITDQPEEIQGGNWRLKDDIPDDPVNYWGVPRLLPDMIPTIDEIPSNLRAWAGSATKDWPDEDQWWLYNWGIDSTSGMKDISKVIVSFYAFDEYFDKWWFYPDRYTTKVLNSGIKFILTPNFSQATEEARIESYYQLFRARWLGRYFQEAGLKVIPDITWRDGETDWLKKHVLATMPKNPNMIALQLQTIDPDEVVGGMEQFVSDVNLVFSTLKPKGALLYVGGRGAQLLDDGQIKPNCPVIRVESRMRALSEAQKGRKKKATI